MVDRQHILDITNRIARQFNPSKIVLFGSYAYGNPSADSDVDLLIIMPYDGVSHAVATKIRMAIDIPFAADILVRSPAEMRSRIRMNDFFFQEIDQKGEVLYEARNCRMGSKSRRGLRHRPARVSRPKKPQL